MEKAELTKEREAASVAEAPTSVCKLFENNLMQMNYLLLFSDWFSGDEKIPQSLYGLRKLGISCVGYGKPWKMTKND